MDVTHGANRCIMQAYLIKVYIYKSNNYSKHILIFGDLLTIKKFDLVYSRFLYGCYAATLLKNEVIFESHASIYEKKNYELKLFEKLINSKYFKKLVGISQALKEMYIEKVY